jgi:hypothetical protein
MLSTKGYISIVLQLSLSCLGWGVAKAEKQTAETGGDASAPSIEISNVLFRYTDDLSVLIVGLKGKLIPTSGHAVADFNDPESFVIAADNALVNLSTAQLSSLMNTYLLASPKAEIKRVQIHAERDHLVIRGTMKKGLHIPFEATAEASITQDNRIRFAIRQVKSGKIPLKGLMDTLGLSLSDLVSQKGLTGLSVDKDSFLIDPQTALPAPQLRAKLSKVSITGQNLVLRFGEGTGKSDGSERTHNFIAMKGGRVRYGRDEMHDADIVMMDTTPADPFEFYLRQYKRQFSAGTIKATSSMAWRAYLPDYAKLNRSLRQESSGPL